MASKTSWLERVLIALSQCDLNLLNEYSSTLTFFFIDDSGAEFHAD